MKQTQRECPDKLDKAKSTKAWTKKIDRSRSGGERSPTGGEYSPVRPHTSTRSRSWAWRNHKTLTSLCWWVLLSNVRTFSPPSLLWLRFGATACVDRRMHKRNVSLISVAILDVHPVGYSDSVVSLPSEVAAAHFSGFSSSSRFSRFSSSQARFTTGSALMCRAILPWAGKDHDCCGPSSTLAMSTWLSGSWRAFRREKLALFLLQRCEFPVVCSSWAFSRALSQHNKSLFARKATVAVDTASRSLISASENWPRYWSLAVLGDRYLIFDHRNLDIKIFTLRYFLAFCGP